MEYGKIIVPLPRDCTRKTTFKASLEHFHTQGGHVSSGSFSVEISKYNCDFDFSAFTCEPFYANAKE